MSSSSQLFEGSVEPPHAKALRTYWSMGFDIDSRPMGGLKAFLGAHAYLQKQFKDDPQGLMDRARDYAGQNSM